MSKIFSVFGLIISLMVVSSSQAAGIPDPDQYRQLERTKMLELLKAGPVKTKVALINREQMSAEAREFWDFYKTTIEPINDQVRDLSYPVGWAKLASDRALYESEAEKERWENIRTEGEKAINAIVYSDDYKTKIKKFAELAKNLTGAFAEQARLGWKRMEIGSYAEAQLPLLNELTDLETKIDDAANTSEFANNLGDVSAKISEIEEAFRAGKLSLEEAAKQVEAERARGERGQSRDIAEKAKEVLNRAAEIRTLLAKSKGYETWAAFRVAVQAEPYADRFNTVEGRIQFLEDSLKETDALLEQLLETMAKRGNLSRQQLRESHVALLQPDATSFGKYFPVETVDEIWAEAVKASGFSQDDVDHITRDVFPRKGKYTHAYMTELNTKDPFVLTVDGATLDLIMPKSDDWSKWARANIFIVQNFFSDSVEGIRTAFHEGGHALHFTHEENPLGLPHAYGYVEIHSMAQEYFLLDQEYLLAKAKSRDGSKPTLQEVESYLSASKVQEFLSFRILLARALFELKQWNTDYTKPGTTFVDESIKLYGETISRGTGVVGTENNGVDSTGRGAFNAPHFRSGWVEYIGYVLANISAFLTRDALLDQFAKETGRRTYLDQPTMAQKLIDGYYRHGYQIKFPGPVENFTGKPYSAESMVKFYKEGVDGYRTSCSNGLSKL